MQRPRDQRHTGRRPHEDGSSDLSDVSPSHRTPRTACSHLKLGEKGLDSPSSPPGGTNLAATLILDSRLQNCEKINFCCFKP